MSQYEYGIVVLKAAARDLLRPEYSNGALAAVATVGFFVFDVSVVRLYTETCPLLFTDRVLGASAAVVGSSSIASLHKA